MKLNSIQFLRAIAALLVVYEHSMDVVNKQGASWQSNFYHLDNFGCIGVDLFFVISGFIITYVAHKYTGTAQGIQFLVKRFARINPAYYIATILYLGSLLISLKSKNIPFVDVLDVTITSSMDTILVVPTSAKLSEFRPLLSIGWTLAFEWLFYILFSILILFNIKLKTIILPSLILLLIIAGRLIRPGDFRLQFITNPIMLEFILGIIICQLLIQIKKIPTAVAFTLLAIGIISYGLLIRFGYGNVWSHLKTITGKLSLSRFFLWGIPSGCIVTGSVFLEKSGRLSRLFKNKWSLLLGNASYSIYLIHYTILGLLLILYTKTGPLLPPDALIWSQLMIVVAISIAFYKQVEQPLLRYMQKPAYGTLSYPKRKSRELLKQIRL